MRQVAGMGVIAAMVVLGAVAAGREGRAAERRPRPGSLVGQFLVATTELRDPRFIRSVVYMARHDTNGALGLIVNRPWGEAPLARVLDRLGLDSRGVSGEIRVHYGGPVQPTRGLILHTADYATEDTQVIKDGIALTWQPGMLRAIGAGTGPRRSLLALGHAGWAPGQLETEIQAGFWVIVPADEALVFDENYETKWKRAMARRIIQL
jgi:putative transcriptional regulator